MEIRDIINEIKNIHDRLDNIGIEARDLRNKLRGIVKSLSKTQHLGDVAPSGSSNNNFTAHSDSPKEKINVPVCQDCKEPLVTLDDDNNRTDLRCPECWAKMEEKVNLED